jgi:hypothetical protein
MSREMQRLNTSLAFLFILLSLIAHSAFGGAAPARVGVAQNSATRVSNEFFQASTGTRKALRQNAVFYISTNGDDSRDGTSALTAWRTCNHALKTLKTEYDFGGHSVTLQLVDGTYAEFSCLIDGPFVGQGSGTAESPIIFQGNINQNSLTILPSAVNIQNTSGACFQVQNGAVVQIRFMWLQCVYDGTAILGGKLFVNNVVDDNCYPILACPTNGAVHYLAQQHGYIQIDGNNYINNSEGSLTPDAIYLAKHHGNIRLHGVVGGAVYLIQNIAVAMATAYAEDDGDITVTGDLETNGFVLNGFDVAGRCFRIEANSTLQWAGGTSTCSVARAPALQFPGLSAGIVQQGGEIFTNGTTVPSLRPVLTFGGNAAGILQSAATGSWQQVGSLVCFSLQIGLASKGSSKGVAVINGLPLPSVMSLSPSVSVMSNNVKYTGSLKASITGTHIDLFDEHAGALRSLTQAAFTNSSIVYVSGCYPVF